MSRYSSAWRHNPTFWMLSDVNVAQDIDLGHDVEVGSIRTITIASEAFTYAHPFVAKIDGIQGRYFSKRLWRAVLRFATDIPGSGIQHLAIDNMLQYKYGVTVHVPNYEALTGEPAHNFSKFTYEEILGIIIMFEEYPSGMHVTPGLKYLIRRAPDPFVEYTARANTGRGFIQFTDKAFIDGITHETQRIILHEKAHFLWDYLFDEHLKTDWIELGGWYYEDERWLTTNQTEFVSDYAHGVNPNEDMAESIAYYIVTPDKLRSRSPAKYEFIQNRIMHGTRYISTIREDLTFVVYNLYPDYVYPGEVIRVDVTVEGTPKGSKSVEIEIETHTENELDYSTGGVVSFRVFNNDQDRPGYFSIRLRPVDAQGRTSFRQNQSNILRGKKFVPSSYATGDYTITQVLTYDANRLTRYNSGGFGLKIHINNIYEDSYPPEYVPNSAKLSVSEAYSEKNEHFYVVTATWQVREDKTLYGYTSIKPIEYDSSDRATTGYYYLQPYNAYWKEKRNVWLNVYADIVRYEGDIWILKSTFYFPHYMPGGVYELNRLYYQDAINRESVYLPNIDEQIQKVTIETKNPDTTPPTLDVNRITVDAQPANPENPDGATYVTVSYYVKDDISGFERGHIAVRDPLGGERKHDIWGPYEYGFTNEIYFQGDPKVFRKYTSTIYLSKGSHPGIWGVIGIGVTDKARNQIYHDFTEITRFEVTETQAAPTVQVTLPDKNALLANYPNPFNPETWIPYQLSKNADVTLRIFNAGGQMVRTLTLGHQAAGMYHSRHRAAYWNGKNAFDEPVASGVYFYTLTADDFTATRKMIIRK
ncbi:hypothetical protein C6497_03580 [Candidatus Poribacteria bacterium]|nr:MAG: hypothetical protein C6497_03580 [Candidatus Poribacteria bacterium]